MVRSENMSKEIIHINFDEYIRQGEPEKKERAEAWRVVHGYQSTRRMEGPRKYPTSTRQVPDKYPTSSELVRDKLHTDNSNIVKLVLVIGEQVLSVKEMITKIGLKDRENFLNLYLTPSIKEGFVRLLYQDKPRHPRQKYLLTVKGLALYKELTK